MTHVKTYTFIRLNGISDLDPRQIIKINVYMLHIKDTIIINPVLPVSILQMSTIYSD